MYIYSSITSLRHAVYWKGTLGYVYTHSFSWARLHALKWIPPNLDVVRESTRHLRDITRHLTVLCLGTSHLYCYIARHHETSRRLYPCPTHETFTRHSLFITFLSSRAVLDSAALLYRLSYRGPSRPSALSTRYAGASSRPQASNASVMLPVFLIFPSVLRALPAKRFQTLWVR